MINAFYVLQIHTQIYEHPSKKSFFSDIIYPYK